MGYRIRFGPFEMDGDAGELFKDGVRIRVQNQSLQILQTLLERPREVVTREELRKRIWPSETFVDFDHGINGAIKRLREALGDTVETPRFLEAVRGGYRFIGKFDQGPAPASVRRTSRPPTIPGSGHADPDGGVK